MKYNGDKEARGSINFIFISFKLRGSYKFLILLYSLK